MMGGTPQLANCQVRPKTIIVTVNGTNQMDLLSGFIPSLGNITFTAQTIMNCE